MENNQYDSLAEKQYPYILDRVKAIVADSIVIIIFMFIATYTFEMFETVHYRARMAAYIFIFILYDPILVSAKGGTIGHFIVGIRVKRTSNELQNILFPYAVFRFVLKGALGWLSLITVRLHKKRKAIHDILVNSVVVYAK